MKRSALWLCTALASASGASGCTSEPPTLALATRPSCEERTTACAESEAASFDVDGVRVLHQRIPGHPLITIQINFDGLDERPAQQLWAEKAALGIVTWAGPKRLAYVGWSAELARLSANFSGGSGLDYASVKLAGPRPHWKALWNLLVETIRDPNTDAYLLEALQRSFHASFDTEQDDPDDAASAESYSRLFAGQTMNALRETQAAIDKLRAPRIVEAWRALRTKRRLLVVVVGDVAREQVRALVARDLAALPDDYAADFADVVPVSGSTASAAVLDYPESPTWHVRAALLGPTADAPDYPALDLGLTVLGERLYDRIREEGGAAYVAGAGLRFFRQSYGQIWFSTPDPQAAFSVTREVVQALKGDGPERDELARAYEKRQGQRLQGRATPSGLAASLADWELTSGSFADFDGFTEAASRVTPDEVKDALQRYLRSVKVVAAGSGERVTVADLATLFE